MRKRPLFKNGPEISVLGLRLIAPPMAPRPRFGEQCLYEMKRLLDEPALALVRKALALGMNFIDTDWASANGHAEEIVGRVLRESGASAFVSSKGGPRFDFAGKLVSDNSRANLMNQCEDSLQRIGLPRLDLFSVNWPDDRVECKQTARGLADLAHNGRTSLLGAANIPLAVLEQLAPHMPLHVVQSPLSLLERTKARGVSRFCAQRGAAFVATDPLAYGILEGKFTGNERFPEIDPERAGSLFKPPMFERAARFSAVLAEFAQARGTSRETFSVAWALAQPGVSAVLIDPQTASEAESWAPAADLALGDSDLRAIDALLAEHQL